MPLGLILMAVLALPGLGLAHLCGAARLTAYATRQDHNTVVTVINKDVNRDASVNISGIAVKQASVTRRTAPSLPPPAVPAWAEPP